MMSIALEDMAGYVLKQKYVRRSMEVEEVALSDEAERKEEIWL
jgi:hypothetical protein